MDQEEITMGYTTSAEAAKPMVRRITEQVQGNGNFEVFDELFAKEPIDHTLSRTRLRYGGCAPTLYLYSRRV
jgi:hypothetical protein